MRFSYNKNVKSSPVAGIILGIIFCVVGVVLLIFGINNINDYNKKNEKYIEITSRVVDYKEQYDEDELLYAIVVEYEVDGKVYRKASNTYTTNPKSEGSEVIIKYNPNNPTDIIWKNDVSNIILPIVGGLFTAIGLIAVVVSIVGLKKSKSVTVDTDIDSNDTLYDSSSLNDIASNNQVQLQNTDNNSNN